MSADIFSLAANAFSVIGLADIILRSADVLYDLVSRSVSAVKTAGRVFQMLDGLRHAIKAIKGWAAAYEQSEFVNSDGRHIPHGLKDLLGKCYKEVENLVKTVQGVKSGRTLSQKFKFAAWQEEEIRRSTDELFKLVQLLTLQIQTVAGNDLVTLRGCHAKTQSGVELVDKRTMTMAQDVQSIQKSTYQSFQAVSSIAQQLGRAQDSTSQGIARIEDSLQHLRLSSGQRDLAVDQVIGNQSSHHTTIQNQSAVSESTLKDMAARLAEITFVGCDDYNITVEGYSLENAIEPLRFMESKLARAMEVVVTSGIQTIPPSHLDWFTSEMHKLKRYAYRSAGTCNLPPRAFRGPVGVWYNTKRTFSTLPLQSSRASFGNAEEFCVIEHVEGTDSYGRKVQRYRFVSFTLDRFTGSRSGVAGLWERSQVHHNPPQITRQLQAIAIVPWYSEAFFCVEKNDLKGLQALFGDRKASPFDYDECGYSLLGKAVSIPSGEDIAMFLLEHGADPHMCFFSQAQTRNIFQVMWDGLRSKRLGSVARMTSLVQSRFSVLDADEIRHAIAGQLHNPVQGYKGSQQATKYCVYDDGIRLPYVQYYHHDETMMEVATELLSQGVAGMLTHQDDVMTELLLCALLGDFATCNIRLFQSALVHKDDIHFNLSRVLRVATGMPASSMPEGTGQLAIVEHLLKHGASPNGRYSTGLSLLHISRSPQVTKLLLDWGADPEVMSPEGVTPLVYAIVAPYYQGVLDFPEAPGAGVKSKHHRNQMPLCLSSEKGRYKIIQVLASGKALIDSDDKNGRTALSHASQLGNARTVRLFLSLGASIDLRDNQGMTPLAYAVDSGRRAAVEVLLANGANVNAKDGHGNTTLYYSIFPRSWEYIEARDKSTILKLLVGHGASTEWVSTEGFQKSLDTWESAHLTPETGNTNTSTVLSNGSHALATAWRAQRAAAEGWGYDGHVSWMFSQEFIAAHKAALGPGQKLGGSTRRLTKLSIRAARDKRVWSAMQQKRALGNAVSKAAMRVEIKAKERDRLRKRWLGLDD